ncbi:MAG TPA: hypothetical protein VGG72_16445 [Bryobacteraceae bacterium]|jgi:hypothetical protein
MHRLDLKRIGDGNDQRLQFWIDGQPFEEIFGQTGEEHSECRLRDGLNPPWELLGDLTNDILDIELRSDSEDHVEDRKQLGFRFDGQRFRASLMICNCGEEECWCVCCAIEIRSRSVVWRDFTCGPFMSATARPLDLHFEFDREQYVAEFVRFCTEKPWPGEAGLTTPHSVLDAGFSYDGRHFIVQTPALYHVWNLKNGWYDRAGTLWEVDYRRRGDAGGEDGIVLSGPNDSQRRWNAVIHDPATVRIMSTRANRCIVELRFDGAHARWLVLDSEGLFEIHGPLSYPIALPTVLGRYLHGRDPGHLRKGLLAVTLGFDEHTGRSGMEGGPERGRLH